MDVKRIHKYFAEDYILSKGDLLDIENILLDYPYFQSLRFVYLKAWYDLDYLKFKDELEKMAIFVSNREALFFFILKDEFTYPSRNKNHALNDDRTLRLIDAFFEETNTVIQDTLDIENSTKNLATTDYLSFLDGIEKKKSSKKQSKEKVNISNSLITLETIEEKNARLEADQTEIEVPNSEEEETQAELIKLEVQELADDTDTNVETTILTDTDENANSKSESLILIESFNKLVARALEGHIEEVYANEDDEDEDDYYEDDDDYDDDDIHGVALEEEKAPVKESDQALITLSSNFEIAEVETPGPKDEEKPTTHTLKEEQIAEQDFNTIGSEEMSALITQRLEESLRMLQELRRTAMSAAKKKEAIIDDFLAREHKPLVLDKNAIKKDTDNYTLEEENSEEELDEGFFTETLAKIYTKQGRYDKAYEIIKHLSLKVPNKNVYFVEQLDYLEKLISKKNKIK